MTDAIFLLQLVVAVALGGFVGEFYRTTLANGVVNRIFLAKFLAGSFLAGMLSYILYLNTENKPLSIIVGALLSYQEEDFITSIVKQFLQNILKASEKKTPTLNEEALTTIEKLPDEISVEEGSEENEQPPF